MLFFMDSLTVDQFSRYRLREVSTKIDLPKQLSTNFRGSDMLMQYGLEALTLQSSTTLDMSQWGYGLMV